MGFSILGFEEHTPAQFGSEDRPHRVVESCDERRHYDHQMLIVTADDDVRDTTSHEPAARDFSSDRYSCSHRASAGVANNNSSTILGDVTLFRDFFLAAFSDYNVACCGGESVFDEQPCNNNPGAAPRKNSYCSAKLAPPGSDSSSYHSYHHPTHIRTSSLIGRTTSSLSQNSAQNNASHDSGGTTKRRQRPLAVAVGFKYAEDMNGRPIIITPGNRLMPVRGPRTSPTSSPSSQPTNYSLRKDVVNPNVFLPFENEYATRKKGPLQPSPLSYKPAQQLQQQQHEQQTHQLASIN